MRLEPRRLERAVEVLGEVGGILEPDVEAEHPFAHPHLGAGLGADRVVRGRGRVAHQRAGVADVVGDVDQLERVEQRVRLGAPAGDLEGEGVLALDALMLVEG